ncbi:Hypothetical protein AKI40_1190 [Enterobacter sp. FY-07]|uniref:hypothetical protein n=1 Tax=Kosakonia oryzendophytica TaxID=1005665 RepID=UPI000777DEBC|nr:hypothetical protein [Kosakonia oryzendophytica]AMO47607.1 Hypothetical protein AKI40_1190 [Enterobacter sp. FY-07]WBT59315.1 hypothetical protein O9K67_05880 [Kosakonia oryzendophytica]
MTSLGMQIASTLLGFTGTILMFFNSYALIPYESAMFGSDEIIEHDRKVEQKNKRMLRNQKIGIGLLSLSFLLQLISYFL